jgi:hypothetical protein
MLYFHARSNDYRKHRTEEHLATAQFLLVIVNPNFKGVDAIICSSNDIWALQHIISRKHKAATKGFMFFHALINWKENVTWHLVMAGLDLTDVRAA